MKKIILGALAAIAIVFGISTAATATSSAPSFEKYNTTFTYVGENTWEVVTHVPNMALHNIGANQSWLCNKNDSGPGVAPCVVDKVYTTNGDLMNGRSCVYIQGDEPAWDTVPNTDKEVCAPVKPTPSPTPTQTVTPSPSPTATVTPSPSPTVSPSPSPTVTPTPTASPTPTSTPTGTPTTSPSPTASVTPSSTPTAVPQPTETTSPLVTKQLAATGGQNVLPFVGLGLFLLIWGGIIVYIKRTRITRK